MIVAMFIMHQFKKFLSCCAVDAVVLCVIVYQSIIWNQFLNEWNGENLYPWLIASENKKMRALQYNFWFTFFFFCLFFIHVFSFQRLLDWAHMRTHGYVSMRRACVSFRAVCVLAAREHMYFYVWVRVSDFACFWRFPCIFADYFVVVSLITDCDSQWKDHSKTNFYTKTPNFRDTIPSLARKL